MIGTTLGDRYTILEKIGIGGMSVVYKAKDNILKRFVAVKILKPQFAEDVDFVRNFSVEAQAAAGLSHPNIINIYDVGMDLIDNMEVHYIVMEYIDGKTLKDIIDESAPLSMEMIQNYGIQIGKALEIAHNNNIIHRDIKPQNILITNDDQVKVTDFGIARVASSSTITYTSTILGTVHYISPEQAKGKFIDKKSDIYALGVVLYEMATGQVPFDGENSVAIAIKHIQEKVVPVHLRNPEVSPGMEKIIAKCLEKRPEDRYSDISHVIDDLTNYRELDHKPDLQETTRMTIDDEKTTPPPYRKVGAQNIYRSKRNPKESGGNRRPPKKKRDIFRTVIFPLILAILILVGVVYGYRYVKDSFSSSEVLAPNLLDYDEDKAKEILTSMGLEGELGGMVEDSGVDEGKIVRQEPLPDTKVKVGSKVVYYISSGETLYEVPDLTNVSINELDSKLSVANLERGRVSYESNDEIEKDRIFEQSPAPHEMVKKNTRVNVVVSRGKKEEKVIMPSLIGKTFEEAKKELEDSELVVKLPSIEEYNDDYDAGLVFDQLIAPGEEVPKNTEILLSVSLGKKPEERDPNEKIKIRIDLTPDPNRFDYPITIVEVDGNTQRTVYSQTYHEGDEPYADILGYPDCLYVVYHGDIAVNQYRPEP